MIAVISYIANYLTGWVVASSISTIFYWTRPVYQTRIFNTLYRVAIWVTTWVISSKIQEKLKPIVNQRIQETADEITKVSDSA